MSDIESDHESENDSGSDSDGSSDISVTEKKVLTEVFQEGEHIGESSRWALGPGSASAGVGSSSVLGGIGGKSVE